NDGVATRHSRTHAVGVDPLLPNGRQPCPAVNESTPLRHTALAMRVSPVWIRAALVPESASGGLAVAALSVCWLTLKAGTVVAVGVPVASTIVNVVDPAAPVSTK